MWQGSPVYSLSCEVQEVPQAEAFVGMSFTWQERVSLEGPDQITAPAAPRCTDAF